MDDDFIPPPLPEPSRRKRRERMRVGPFMVSSAVVAWGASLLVHGTVAVAAVFFVRSYLRDTPPELRFTLGGGSQGGVVARPGSPGTPAMPDAGPASPSAQLPMATPQTLAQAEDRIDADAARVMESAASAPAPSPGPDPSQLENPSDWAAASSGDSAGAAPRVPRAAAPGGSSNPAAPSAPPGVLGGNGPIGNPGSQPPGEGGSGDAGGSDASGTAGEPAGLADRSLPAPAYPEISRRRGERGTVKLAVEVLADGTIGQIRVIEDPGYPRLVESAIAAVRQARFVPARHYGRPVTSVVNIPFNFALR